MDTEDYSPMFNHYDHDIDEAVKVQINKRYSRVTSRKAGQKKRPLPSNGKGQVMSNQLTPKIVPN